MRTFFKILLLPFALLFYVMIEACKMVIEMIDEIDKKS